MDKISHFQSFSSRFFAVVFSLQKTPNAKFHTEKFRVSKSETGSAVAVPQSGTGSQWYETIASIRMPLADLSNAPAEIFDDTTTGISSSEDIQIRTDNSPLPLMSPQTHQLFDILASSIDFYEKDYIISNNSKLHQPVLNRMI